MQAGANRILVHIVPFFQRRDRNFVMIDADAIHPFLFLRDVVYRDKGLGRGLLHVLGKIDSCKRDLEDLADRQRLGQGHMIEGGQFLWAYIVQPADAIPILFGYHGMFEIELTGLAKDGQFIGCCLGVVKLYKKTADQKKYGQDGSHS